MEKDKDFNIILSEREVESLRSTLKLAMECLTCAGCRSDIHSWYDKFTFINSNLKYENKTIKRILKMDGQ